VRPRNTDGSEVLLSVRVPVAVAGRGGGHRASYRLSEWSERERNICSLLFYREMRRKHTGQGATGGKVNDYERSRNKLL
jgi:hypothetical protein